MRGFVAFVGAACLAGPAVAETDLWADMAREDLSAARTLIVENHPAAVPEHGDEAFLEGLRDGYAAAQTLAAEARDYRTYRASLRRFASALGDIHIWSNPHLDQPYAWPGFLVSLVDNEWRVLPHEDENLPPVGAELVSCDGETPDRIAASRLALYTLGWHVPAQRKRRSIRLLVDRGETPFERYEACRFRTTDGAVIDHTMAWRNFSNADYNAAANAARPNAGSDLGLMQWRDGWWIRVGTLSDAAGEIANQAIVARADIAAAPYVVVDLRGNSGGSEYYANQIAAVLYGTDAVEEAEAAAAEGDAAIVWRVSEDNLATLDHYTERFTTQLGAENELVTMLIAEGEAMREALAAGDAFSSGNPDGASQPASEPVPAPDRQPRVYLVTDNSCFSSCLGAARLFRNLGATHVGQETSAATHYYEVRQIDLPSGLSTFSTLQSFARGMPRAIGPFAPSIELDDETIANDEHVQAALAEIIAGSLSD